MPIDTLKVTLKEAAEKFKNSGCCSMNKASNSEHLWYKVESAILKDSLGYATALLEMTLF